MDELVVRVVLKKGADRDRFAEAISAALAMNPAIDMVTVDMNESGPVETLNVAAAGGLTLEETRRLYVRFGPRPDERLRLARQQHSMLGMLLTWPTIRGAKKLIERLREWDAHTQSDAWAESSEGAATKVYSRLADELDKLARHLKVYDSGLYRLTRRKGVYGWLALLPEGRK